MFPQANHMDDSMFPITTVVIECNFIDSNKIHLQINVQNFIQ